mmetsp:Transcript_50292/g.106882  ORF Transcript_50292/g.106882 Transcript_50292/m.106882 type:complete len:252 (-) Transcript_50292:234-989(-)
MGCGASASAKEKGEKTNETSAGQPLLESAEKSAEAAAAQPAAQPAEELPATGSKALRVLVIRSSPRPDGHSNKVTSEFVNGLKAKLPDADVVEWLLEEKTDIPDFGQAIINGKGADGTEAEKALWQQGVKIIDEFKSFDLYVVGSQMWNFAVSPKLKNLIDVLLATGHTFEYVDGAPKGLLVGKRVLFVCAHLGSYPNGGLDNDFQLPYLKYIWNLMGVSEQKDIPIIAYKGDDADTEPLEQARALVKDWA